MAALETQRVPAPREQPATGPARRGRRAAGAAQAGRSGSKSAGSKSAGSTSSTDLAALTGLLGRPRRWARALTGAGPLGRLRTGGGLRRADRWGATLRETSAAIGLVVALALAVLPWSEQVGVAMAAVSVWMLAGVLVLGPALLIAHALIVSAAAWVAAVGDPAAAPVVVLCLVVLDGMVLGYGTRDRPQAARQTLGESMLGAVNELLSAQQVPPRLGPGWHLETARRAADDDAICGDFLLSSTTAEGAGTQFVLVDVCGKGRAAGARALLLSGVFGGMLGELPVADFLPAANRYLLSQNWDEGFATAIHAWIDLDTGRYRISGAGHPPAARFDSGAGRWQLLGHDHGPLLGVVADAAYPAVTGTLNRGDALLLYTDGMIELPGRDVQLGIDRLLGCAERVVSRGFRGGATMIMDDAPVGTGDDRALLLLWRS